MTKEVLIDTNFILTCMRQKIDFFEKLEFEGFRLIIPDKVILELKKFSAFSKSRKLKLESELALKIIAQNKFGNISLEGKSVDAGIIKFLQQNPKVFLASLDQKMQKSVKNNKVLIRGKKVLEER